MKGKILFFIFSSSLFLGIFIGTIRFTNSNLSLMNGFITFGSLLLGLTSLYLVYISLKNNDNECDNYMLVD